MKRYFGLLLLLGFTVYMLFLNGCGSNSQASQNDDKEETVVIPVEIAEVKCGNISAYFTGTATLEAEEETEVVAKVGGIVKKIMVEEGDFVSADQILAKLDDEKLSLQVQQSEANFQKLANEYQRSEELFKKNLISVEEYQSAKYNYHQQKAAANLAKLDHEYTSIRSPIDGVVAQRMVKVGNMVLINQAAFHVTGLDPLKAVLYVPERQIPKLRIGQTSTFKVDALEENVFHGKIERISPVVDPTTGTVKVTVMVRDPDNLKPGMFARIQIIHNIHRNALLVPKDAILSEDKENVVFVIKDSLAYRRLVKTGYINTSHIEVLSGLNQGDTVVTTGKGSLKDSSKVEIVRQQLNSIAMH